MSELTITHTHADGTLLEGDPRPHHGTLKQLGWRGSRNLGAWYWPHSRDRDAYQPRLDATAEDMRAHGFTVTIDVDNTPRSAADRIAAGMARAEQRAERLDAKADRLDAESDARYAAYRQTADHIPLGQPMLTDHYSYKSDRSRRDKMIRNAEKSFELARDAEDTRRRASVAARRAEGKTVGQTRRKIDELEAEDRKIGRALEGDAGLHYGPPASGEYRDRLLRRRGVIVDEVAYWRDHLATLEQSGAKMWGPEDFKPGDYVNGRDVVVRVNKKSLSVSPRYKDGRPIFSESHTLRLGYDGVKSHQRPLP